MIEKTEELMSGIEDKMGEGADVRTMEDRLQTYLAKVTQTYREDWEYLTRVSKCTSLK